MNLGLKGLTADDQVTEIKTFNDKLDPAQKPTLILCPAASLRGQYQQYSDIILTISKCNYIQKAEVLYCLKKTFKHIHACVD